MYRYFICYEHPTYGRSYETWPNEASAFDRVAELQSQFGLPRDDIFVFHETTAL